MTRLTPLALVVVGLLGTTPARAQEVGPAMLPAAATVEAIAPDVPVIVLQEDAARLFEQAVPRSPPPPAPAAGDAPIVVPLEGNPAVNGTTRFVFQDVTDRTQPQTLTLPQRQAAVQALRQSLRRPAGSR